MRNFYRIIFAVMAVAILAASAAIQGRSSEPRI
jgi:hypothetical protein